MTWLMCIPIGVLLGVLALAVYVLVTEGPDRLLATPEDDA